MTFNLQPSFCTIYTLYLTCFIFQESRSKSPLLTGEFDPKNFLDKVPDTDDTGISYPDWKKHLLARQLAEKALQDAEEEKKVFHKEENIRGGIPLLTGFTLSHICSCPKQGPRFPTSYIMVLFMFYEWR